jgi:hypothetical protein
MAALRSSFSKVFGKIRGKSPVTAESRVYEERVVVIHSPFKTGTTTIGWALVMAGFADKDHGYHQNLNIAYKHQINEANSLARETDSFETFKSVRGDQVIALMHDLLQHAVGYRIFGDLPFGHLLIHPFVKKLLMPNARFIWIDRNEEAWLASARKWHLAHPALYPGADKRWEKNPEGEKLKLIRLRDDGFREFQKLQKSFPQDCMIMSLEKDANWQPLCSFLGLPIPDAEFPVLNRTNR